MASTEDSSLAFFQKGTPEQWAFVYNMRDAAIQLKADQRKSKKGGPEEFLKLDTWYREKLPKLIHSRKEPHVLYDELVQIAKWKMMMGKYRPKNLDLVRINTDSAVTSVTRKAYKKLLATKSPTMAVQMLVNLKGIGASAASAILSAAYPDQVPFMSDEGMSSTPGVEAGDCTIAEFTNYSEALLQKTEYLKSKDPEFNWTPHKVDQVLWIYYLTKENRPELLEAMPASGSSPSRSDNEADVLVSSNEVGSSSLPEAHNVDDNANDCTSTTNTANLSANLPTNGSYLSNGLDVDSENSASVPFSEDASSSSCPPVPHSNGVSGSKRSHSELEDGVFNQNEDSCSKDFGVDSEDSNGEARLNILTPSEENSVDGMGPLSCDDNSTDDPPLKKPKNLTELTPTPVVLTAAADK